MLSKGVEENHYARFDGSSNYSYEIARVNETVDGHTYTCTDNQTPMSHHASRCDKKYEHFLVELEIYPKDTDAPPGKLNRLLMPEKLKPKLLRHLGCG